jgi:hypothetical protein
MLYRIDMKELILKSFLGLFGICIAGIGVVLVYISVENWTTPPYGIAGGLVAISVGLSIVYTAYSNDSL